MDVIEVCHAPQFPRLRAGTFIEAIKVKSDDLTGRVFPRLRAGTFIEAR